MKLIRKNKRAFLRIDAADAACHPQLRAVYAIGMDKGFTWQRLIGVGGHVGQMVRVLQQEQLAFGVDLLRFFRDMRVVVRDRTDELFRYGDNLTRPGVADELIGRIYIEPMRHLITEHVQRTALAAAAIEWEMHQRRRSVKEIRGYVAKGLWDMITGLPRAVTDAITARVSSAVDKAEDIIQSVTDRVRAALEGMRGQDREAKRRAVDDVFAQEANERRAMGIILTEGTKAAGLGGYEASKALAGLGLINARRWMTLHGTGGDDGRVRGSHLIANGQTVRIGQQFQIPGPGGRGVEYCDYPGDTNLSAGNRCNCRCLAVGVSVSV